MDFPVTIKLRHPVAFGKDQLIEELTLRRGIAADIRDVKVGDIAAITMSDVIRVAGRMAGQVSAVMDKIDMDDLPEIFAAVMDFLGRSLVIGEKPSP